MKLGYARVSTDDQSLAVQLEQLKAAGCSHIFREHQSGKSAVRPQLQAAMLALETRVDPRGLTPYEVILVPEIQLVLVVTKLDRLARNTRDLLEIVDRIGKAGAGLVSLGEPWANTTSPAGKLIMTVFAGIAEFERARILERTSEGRALAKRNGVHMGRPGKFSAEQRRAILKMLKESPVKEVARVFKADPTTIRRMRAGL